MPLLLEYLLSKHNVLIIIICQVFRSNMDSVFLISGVKLLDRLVCLSSVTQSVTFCLDLSDLPVIQEDTFQSGTKLLLFTLCLSYEMDTGYSWKKSGTIVKGCVLRTAGRF